MKLILHSTLAPLPSLWENIPREAGDRGGTGAGGWGVQWPAVDVIVGNPPFLGDKQMRGELGDEYV